MMDSIKLFSEMIVQYFIWILIGLALIIFSFSRKSSKDDGDIAHAIEIMDGSFSLHALCVEYLVKSNSSESSSNLISTADVYSVPNDIDELVARYALEENGITLKNSTFEQKEYLKKSELGT